MHDLMDAAGAARLTKEVGVPGALDRPILVVGAARSGTWMLASILGLHPEGRVSRRTELHLEVLERLARP